MNKDLTIHKLHDYNGLGVTISGESAFLLTGYLIKLLKDTGGKNFLTWTVNKGNDKYAVTIENLNGSESPAEIISRLTAENAELKTSLIKKDNEEFAAYKRWLGKY